jgi:exonuclease III
MIVLSWNCRDLGRKSKEDALRDLIRVEKPTIILIQETKLEEVEELQIGKNIWKKTTKR